MVHDLPTPATNGHRVDDQPRGATAAGSVKPPAAATGSVEDENAQLRRRVRELAEERDILRHTFVTTMLDPGVSLRDVQIAARPTMICTRP